MKKFNNNYRATVKNTLLEMMCMSGTLCEGPGDRREHDLLTQDEAENGNPRENRIKTRRRYEALPPEEKKARGERANKRRKDERDEARARMTPEERAAQDAKPTGAWRIDPATGEKLKNAKGEVMDSKEYAAIDKANGIKTPSEFGDGRTLGQRLAGVGKHQRVYEPMTKADQQKRYDNSSKDINNPGYDNSEYGKRQRQKEWEAIDKISIENKNSHTAALAAQGRLNKIQADAKARLPASTARRVAGERKLASMEADPNLKGSLAQRGATIQAANIANRARGY